MRTIGRYELLTQLASGNTGYVFSACRVDDPSRGPDWSQRPHVADDASHAVKLIKPRLAQDPRYVGLLRAEASAAIAFRHPNAVRMFEIGQVGPSVFHALEIVRGQTLATVLQRAAAERRYLAPDLSLWIAYGVARALTQAHDTPWSASEERGMLHGEVSPQSVLISYDGEVKLLGVGVGRSRLALPPARSRLPYRAPELFATRRADAACDVYGLGVLLYDALSGTRVFYRDSVQETTQAVLEHEVRPVHHLVPEVGERVSALVAATMARAPGDRPHSMSELEGLLRDALVDDPRGYRAALAEQMRALFATELGDLPWVEFTPGFVDVNTVAQAAEEADALPGVARLWRVAPEAEPDAAGPAPAVASVVVPTPPELAPPVSPVAPVSPVMSEVPPAPEEGVRREPYPMPLEAAPRRNPEAEAAVARSMDPSADSDAVDALVDAIVSASSRARQGQPAPSVTAVTVPSGAPLGRRADDKVLVVKEAFRTRAIVDVSIDPRSKPRSPLALPLADSASPADTPPAEAPPLPPASGFGELETLPPGELIGERYRVIEKLGSGGMAVVYKVEHTLLEKAMALKLLRPELSTIPYVVERFQREARFVSQLDDPRIVRVTDFGRAESGSLFIVMELIEGVPLAQLLARGPFDLAGAMSIMEQVLLGLDHAHKKNVIHRDLKPDNIMLVEREGRFQVKIVDFGIAKLSTADTPLSIINLTQDGMVFGSPRYMSPEQASGEGVDARTDVYAAGVICYELLTGRRPFDGRSARAILSLTLTRPPPPMRLEGLAPRVAQAVEAVVMSALAKDKEHRPGSAMAMLDALRGASRDA